MNLDDTIVAIATPPGRGGIGVVRLSGPEAKRIAGSMLRLISEIEPRHATITELVEPESGDRLDEVVVTWFAKPHSYTTDDVVEISCHGAPIVLRNIVERALAKGARLAEPGEFTMRAFLKGRIDLTQAEAVRDLIESQTLFQAKVAAQQLEGALANRLRPIKQSLVELIAELEAGVDFAEDDVPVMPAAEVLPRIAAIRGPLEELAKSFSYGRVVHEGLTLAIVGRPNVGKSSLFNCLVESERAIVTATPGTTRDLVSETVAIEGIPVRLVDTAGIRAASDEAEAIGVQRSYEALADADVVLVVIDLLGPVIEQANRPAAVLPSNVEDNELLAQTEGRPRILVFNKCDLEERLFEKGLVGRTREAMDRGVSTLHLMAEAVEKQLGSRIAICTSALTGEGIPELRKRIVELAGAGAQQEPGFLTNARHHKLVQDSLAALRHANAAVEQRLPHEMLLLDLYGALRPLDEITGATTAEDILNVIFSRFCIGK